MKLLLTRNTEQKINGYETVENITHIDAVCCDAEAVEIKIDNFLSLHHYNIVKDILLKICSKLRLGGEIVISDIEPDLICYQAARGLIDPKTFNELLFNDGPISSLYGAEYISEILNTFCGINITERYIENNRNFVLKGTRC